MPLQEGVSSPGPQPGRDPARRAPLPARRAPEPGHLRPGDPGGHLGRRRQPVALVQGAADAAGGATGHGHRCML